MIVVHGGHTVCDGNVWSATVCMVSVVVVLYCNKISHAPLGMKKLLCLRQIATEAHIKSNVCITIVLLLSQEEPKIVSWKCFGN